MSACAKYNSSRYAVAHELQLAEILIQLFILFAVIQFYRKLPNGNYEVMMSIAYDREKITNISKETVNGMMKEAGLDIEVMQ